jgi:protocatechuate 3,4-dioxygenase beta subunit
MTGARRLPAKATRTLLGLILAAGLGAAGGALAGPPAAVGDPGTNPSSTTTGSPTCPASNPPDTLTLVGGSPQTAALDAPYASGLQVALANGDGCPLTTAVAGIPVTFSAPASGASGRFSASGTNTVTVGTDASGSAAASSFTAGDTPGSYTVTASSAYGTVSFSLTNTAAGVSARIAPLSPTGESATVAGRFAAPLRARVTDAGGSPVPGATVVFALASTAGGSGASGSANATASASFADGSAQATEMTDASGVATSPLLRADTAAGAFTATASTAGIADPATFTLRNLAGRPATVTAGAASAQSASTGARFPIRLAVTVTDAHGNPVAGALVTFSAPRHGPSGGFGSARHSALPRTAARRTDASGVAVAPPFTANADQGGYIVKASVEHARSAAFALVNAPPGQSP